MFARSRVWLAAAAAAAPAVLYQLNNQMPAPHNILAVTAESAFSQEHVVPLNTSECKLRLVQVVFRHGARTVLSDEESLWSGVKWDMCHDAYEGVPLSLTTVSGGPRPPCKSDARQIASKLDGGCHKGQLTHAGQLQARDLGKWLRQQYVEASPLLPAEYQDGAVASRTTNFQRTVATLRGILTGLYPSATRPLPAVVSSELDEILYADSKSCPHIGLFSNNAKASVLARIESEEQKDLARRLQAVLPDLGEKFWKGNAWTFVDLHDILTSLRFHGKPIPDGMTPELLDEVDRVATEAFRTFLAPSIKDPSGHALLRLSMGRLIDILVSNMAAVVEGGEAGASMYLYSGHDSTLLPMLAALGHDVETWPPYLSNIVLELWEQPEGKAGPRYLVRVLYNREELPLPGCTPGQGLDLDAFRERVVGPFLLSEQDHKEACRISPSHDTSMPIPTTSASSLAGGDDE